MAGVLDLFAALEPAQKVALFDELPPEARAEAVKLAAALPDVWRPNPGPQRMAHSCVADELFYGGQAGGGKTDLGIGLALTAHKRSLILRRINKDAVKLVERCAAILGHRDGYNGQLQRWRLGDRLIEFAGCEQETDKQRFKGDPHDLIYFDEGTDFLASQYRFIIGWNRSADPGQRCRVVVGSNPPTTAEGLWVIRHWAPWLDPVHPRPARPGELRWFTTGPDGEDLEVDGPGPHLIGGERVGGRSRTYIPARLSDNPDQNADGSYAAVLAGLPPELRRAYRDGDFQAGLEDHEHQVIPTAWIEAAQRRWTPQIPRLAMTAMGVDVAQGGADKTVVACRYGGWYAQLIVKPGKETREGADVAAMVVRARRNACPVIIDVGGGFGADAVGALERNGIVCVGYLGLRPSLATSKEGRLKFANKRAESWWRMREELDPEQEGGSCVALPPGPTVKADLAAPRFTVTTRGISIEDKEDLKKRLGHSPDEGDAIVMCLSEGSRAVAQQLRRVRNAERPERANVGHADVKARLR
jgi:hypothetical protein